MEALQPNASYVQGGKFTPLSTTNIRRSSRRTFSVVGERTKYVAKLEEPPVLREGDKDETQ